MASHPTWSRRDLLNATGAAAALALSRRLTDAAERKGRPPNIIFILGDDLGWAELGCYGNTFNETPNLDRLARRGLRFTDAYAAAPVCSPYRASLMVGQWPARVGMTDYLRPNDPKHLPTDLPTIASVLKEAGYATGIIGKWHLTGYAAHGAKEYPPDRFGFDEVLLSENHGIGGGSYFHPYHFNPQVKKRLEGREYLVDRMNLEAVEFIERHRARPFFLYLSHYAVHTALVGKPELAGKYAAKPGAGNGPRARRNNPHLAAQLESLDQGVGMILAKLGELGLAENTLIVFTGDNGGEDRVTTNGPLRAGKSTLYEGGIRVPLIVHWPARVKGGVSAEPVSSVDFFPTLCAAAGTPAPQDATLDGASLMDVLADPAARVPSRELYWHYPLEKPHFLGGRSAGAIRDGDWKLIEFFETGSLELYNLADDLGEKHDLAARYPHKAAELRKKLVAWRERVGAKCSAP